MPRGSKPGERRGGRARGTPNKKTVLKDAVFSAAAAKPNTSPLDFMLGVMRDPKVPMDLRIEMAASAAPFVHPRLKSPPKVRIDRFRANFTVRRMEAKLTPSKPGETGGAELSPLEFLLGVMTDPEVKPQQRIKAARIAARYKHPQADGGQAPVVIEDKYGFKIDLELAKSIRDDRVRSRSIYDTGDYMFYQGSPRQAEFDRESAEIGARFVEYRKELNARPAAYTREEEMKDWRRIEEFFKRRRLRQTLSQEELLEEAILYTRGVDPSPPAPRRLVTLKEAVEMYDRAEAERLKKNSESTSPTNPISNGA